MNYTIAYTYARGYYDGRAKGEEVPCPGWFTDDERHAYRSGYERGVSDYCEFDEGEQA